MHLNLELALSGLGVGAAIALMASGLLVTFKGSGVLNLAQGALATASVYGYLLFLNMGWPRYLAIVGGLALGVAIAGLFYAVVMRRMVHAPDLAKMVATLGLMLGIQGITSALTGSTTPTPPSLIAPTPVTLPFGFTLGGDRLVIVLFALVITAALSAIFRYTRFGLLTQALAENQRAVILSGNSADKLGLVTWCFGGLLAGVAGIILSSFVPISPTFFTLIMITAIAAALIGGLRSFWITFVAAIVIGLAQPVLVAHGNSLLHYTGLSDWADALPYVIIIIVVLIRGRVLPVRDSVVAAILPRVTLPRHAIRNTAVLVVAGILLFEVAPKPFIESVTISLIGSLVCLSLVVIVGYVGQISLAQMAFAGFGAFATSVFATQHGVPFPWTIPIAGLAAVPLGLVIALPAVRVRGIQLAVVTLAAAAALDDMVFQNNDLTHAAAGEIIPAPHIGGLSFNGVLHPRTYGILVLVVVAGCGVGVAQLRRTSLGQRFLAVRVNERGAAASGIAVPRTKILAFCISAALAGLAGSLIAYNSLVVSYDGFSVLQSIFFVGIAYIGGIGSVAGAFIGGLLAPGGIVSYISSSIWSSYWLQAVSGLLLVQIVVNHPDGLAGAPAQVRRAIRLRQARRETVATAEAEDGEVALPKVG